MKIDENQITRVARLARLDLSSDEKKEFSQQLSGIIAYVEKINGLDTEKVEPADHIVALDNVLRPDQVRQSMNIDRIKDMAPDFDRGHFVVPRIIEG